jgi:Uma2 family endonuclease
MSTVIVESQVVRTPPWVVSLDSFRRWTDFDEFPEAGRSCYFEGEVWADISKEQVFTHIDAKDECTAVLRSLAQMGSAGRYFSDGLRLTNLSAGISTVPDGTFVSAQNLQGELARLVEGGGGSYLELEGQVDMVLEIVSDSSVHKDTVVLFQAYWKAGISEYWLVDASQEPLRFDIYRHTAKGYRATRKQAGWLKSNVFGKSFQLTWQTDPLGYPQFKLLVR